ncbi:MAG: DUF3857 domain-containing protein, partial [Candidatus Hinthialibacter sp.]
MQAFEDSIEANAQDHLAHAGLAALAPSRAGSEHRALSEWLAALEAGRSQPEAVLYLFQALENLSNRGDYQEMLSRVEAMLEDGAVPDHLRAMLLYSRTLLLNRLGRWDDAAQNNAGLGLVTRFWYCGPFDNAEEGGHNRVYGPEENLDLTAEYEGRRKTVSWTPLPIEPANGYIDLNAMIDPSAESTTYLAAMLQSTVDQRIKIHLGHAGALKVWLNGKLLADVDRYHDIVPDQVNLDGQIQSGSNVLLLKISSGEKGKYGVYVRINPKVEDSVAIQTPSELQETPDWKAYTPRPGEDPQTVNFEPLSLQLLKAIGEAAGGYPHRPLFYALMLQRWHTADENDSSANTLISQLTGLFPENPLLWRLRGESEKQANRRRLGFTFALQKDPADQASFLNLLDYYRKSPFAEKGLESIRDWSENNSLTAPLRFEQARLLREKGLREAAVDLLQNADSSDWGCEERMFFYSLQSSRMTDKQKRENLEAIIQDYPYQSEAVMDLLPILLRQGDLEAAEKRLEHLQRIDPFSTAGLMEMAGHLQAKKNFDESLLYLDRVKKICPDHFEAHRLSAAAYHQMGDDEKAIEEIKAALITRPSDPWCLDYLEFLQPDEDSYADPYLIDWKTIETPDDLDLSEANYQVLLDQRIVKVHPNGNSSETIRQAVKILTETGVRYQQVRGVYYESGHEEVRIKRARVWKPDGSFFDAPAPVHRSASSQSNAAERLYEDYRVAILQFQGLEKGSVLELEYEKKDRGENIYAEYFGDLVYIGDRFYEPTVRSDYVLITPKSREFYYKYVPPHYPEPVAAPSLESMSTPQVDESGADRVWHWTFVNLPRLPREPLMPAAPEILPYLKVSTFQTWKNMTEWYWNLSRDQLIPGSIVLDRLKKVLADYRMKYEIPPEEELSDWDKVRAVNSFVNTDVRYLGLEFGIHGYKPHKVDEICSAQYGDCKDKAALAVAMLKELGVEANMVILRTTDQGEIDYELPMLGIFNHAIYYVPDVEGKEYWIDGTATFFDSSELPPGDAGANSLIVKPGGDYEFKRIPHSQPDENGAVFTTHIQLDGQGAASGFRTAEFRGLYNPVVRRTYENPVKAKEIVDRMLAGAFPGAQSSDIELSDLEDYSTPERLAYKMTIPQYGVQQNGRWTLPSTLFKEEMSQRFAVLSQREYDLVLNYPWTR